MTEQEAMQTFLADSENNQSGSVFFIGEYHYKVIHILYQHGLLVPEKGERDWAYITRAGERMIEQLQEEQT